MSNSSLVNYTMISPNRTVMSNKVNKIVTIHCTVGQFTAKQIGNIFAARSRRASCNYGIGKDGDIVLCVEEKDGSWCSGGLDSKGNIIKANGISGSKNDTMAITIEVASDITHPYKITDAAYKSLIKLLVDICKRNPQIGTLKWEGNKSLVGNWARQNMTVHRWFANKACPGDYLYNLHSQIAKEVNAQLSGGSTPQPTPTPAPTPVSSTTDVFYKVKAGGKWLPEVKNLTDYAGIEQKGITGIAIRLADNSGIKYRVHLKGKGWLPYVTGCNINDYNNGFAGDGKTFIDAIEIVGTKHNIKYRVSVLGTKNYYSYQVQNKKGSGMDGYAGSFGSVIDKVQIACQ